MKGEANENNSANYRIDNEKTRASKHFEYNAKITGKRADDNNIFDRVVIVPLK